MTIPLPEVAAVFTLHPAAFLTADAEEVSDFYKAEKNGAKLQK